MQSLIQKLTTRHLMNAKYGIMTKQVLITLEKQLFYFPGKKTLRNLNINDMGFLFNKTVKNIISNHIPHETITFDDRNPPWINKNAKQLILEKNEMYKKYVNENKDPRIFDKVNVSKTN